MDAKLDRTGVKMHSIQLALRLFRRDWRAGELTTLAQALVVAVTIMTAVSLFADRLRAALWTQSSTFLAADRVLEGTSPLPENWPEDWWEQIGDIGVERSRTVRFISMVFSDTRSRFASVKAVDDDYPLRGKLKTASGLSNEATVAAHGPAPGEVWLEPRLIPALDTAVGATLEVGAAGLRIGRIIDREPDRGGGFDDVGPRVMMHLDDLDSTEVVQPGSRVTYRYLFAGDSAQLARLDALVQTRLKGSGFRYLDAYSAVRGIGRVLRRVERFLLMGGLLGILLAGMAITLTGRRYAMRHFDHIALMKSFGATTRDIGRLFALIMALLLLSATAVGLLAGTGIQFLIAFVLRDWMPPELPPPGLRPFLVGGLTGGLCLLAFALPSLLRLCATPPIRVIRRDFEHAKSGFILQYGLGSAGFVALLLWYSRDLTLAGVIVGGIGVTSLLFGGLILAVLNSGRALGMRTSSPWRLALSGMQRRRQESVLQILAFGLAMMLLLTLILMRTSLLAEWRERLPEGAPDHFMINISPDEKSPIEEALRERGIRASTLYPIVRGRAVAVNGLDVGRHVRATGDSDRPAPAAGFERNLTWSATVPHGNEIIDGAWWGENHAGDPLISLEKSWATRNGIGVGDNVDFLIQGRPVSARVASIRELDWNTMRPNFFIVFSPQPPDAYAPTYMTSFFLPQADKLFLNELLRKWPTVTVIEIDSIVERLQSIMDQGALAVQIMLLLILIAGVLVLLTGIQAGMEERVRQQAIIRTLGANHRLVMKSLICEFCTMGALAGLLAATGTEITAWALQTQVFRLGYTPHPWLWVVAPAVGIAAVGGIGTLATRGLMRLPPGLTLMRSGTAD